MSQKYDFNKTLLPQLNRYNELFYKASLTTLEQTEYDNLVPILAPYMVRAQDWNDIYSSNHVKLVTSLTAPTNPNIGDVWIDLN